VGVNLPFFMMLPEPTMLEIHRHYVLDETGEPIGVQIQIEQFEALLTMLKDPDPKQPTLAEISGIVRDVRQELWAQS
jgi:hypothetical protein